MPSLLSYPRSASFLFAAFLFAGVLKELPLFASVPVDLTLLTLVASGVACLLVVDRFGVVATPAVARGVLLMALLVAWSLLSLSWSPGRDYAADKALHFGLLGSWSFAGGIIIGGGDGRTLRFGRSIVFLGAWLSLEVIVMFAGGAVLATAEWGESYIAFGRLIGYGVLVLVSRVLAEGAAGWRGAGRLVLLGALATGLLMGGARGPLAGTVAGLVVMALAGVRVGAGRITVHRRLLALAAALVVVPGVAIMATRSGVFFRTIERLLVLASSADAHSFGRRLWYWREAWDRIWETPVFGHGLGSWPLLIGWNDARAYPHDILLELGVELGLVGVALFLLLAANALPMARWRRDPGSLDILVAALATAALVNALISGDLVDNRVLFAFLGLATARCGRLAS